MAKKKVKKQIKTTTMLKMRRTKPSRKGPVMREVVRSAAQSTVPQRQTHVAPLSSDQVQKFRDVLSQKREDLLAVVQRKKEEEIMDIGVGDEADIASHSIEKEMLFELTDSEKQTLDMVEAALRKMDKSIYGICESCHRGIPRMRLQVMPWARYCIDCQSKQEVPAGE